MDNTKWLDDYIPAGCLQIRIDDKSRSILRLHHASQSRDWKLFTSATHVFPPQASLPATVQDVLLELPVLEPFLCLWQKRWIEMAFNQICSSDGTAHIRVYILPHDINRSFLQRTSELAKATTRLVSQLQQSSAYWNGYVEDTQRDSTLSGQGDPYSLTEEDTLLSIFNNVPSPDPQPELETNLDTRDGMQCLLESRVPGLTTKLYPYQGRSAALMFQREENPSRIVDPRYKATLDQEGKPWYFDNTSGEILRGAKYYDRVRGGILAEEMGTGKTLICLALILCTLHEPSKVPEPFEAMVPPRTKIASLMDMAAAAANKHSIPWKPYFEAHANSDYKHCIRALTAEKNRAYYVSTIPLVQVRKSSRIPSFPVMERKIFLSSVTLVVVPNNLVKQWQTEINKHTTSLKVLVLAEINHAIPLMEVLLGYDIILISETYLGIEDVSPLMRIRFKRCIVDEGHKLGNGSRAYKSNVMRRLERFEIAARWVVTGTPSRGLYGVDQPSSTMNGNLKKSTKDKSRTFIQQEKDDLQRIGNLATKYLKARPWANTKDEMGDRVANWNVYVMHPSQHSHGRNRKDCVKTTLDSLIIRHRRSDVSTLLPPVEEKIVLLDGSFQDKLSLNLFSMMIIFNSVQSQRTDMDYFFHERQRKNLIQLVKNLRQACFFGGVFYSVQDIQKALETAEGFLEKKEIPISAEDEDLLTQAIAFGKLAVTNKLKDTSNKFHAMPLYLDGFPGGGGKGWSLDDKEVGVEPICTDAGMIQSLQKFLSPYMDAPASLEVVIDSGQLERQGTAVRSHALAVVEGASARATAQKAEAHTLAGNTPLGKDHRTIRKPGVLGEEPEEGNQETDPPGGFGEIPKPLLDTRIISTVSVKLSYLIDSIVKYQGEEQILVFYDNDNIAYYLASVLEILQIQHLIYARTGLTTERRAQYVATFTQSPKFRVMLMDISQAAFGLDMRSASRIYFISPVLNPQVEAQAIGRARRISQQKPVSVETLVLRNSIEEVIVNRRKEMTQAEHSKTKSVLDDRLIYQWILNAKIIPMPDGEDGVGQTAMLGTPKLIFGRGFGREYHPDEGLITGSPETKEKAGAATSNGTGRIPFKMTRNLKRPAPVNGGGSNDADVQDERPPKRRARVTFAE